MPLDTTVKDNIKFPTPNYLTLSNWKRGVITLIDKSRLPKDALEEATNIFLYEDGMPGPRPGVDWYGEAPGRTPATSFSASPSASRSPSASTSPSPSASLSPSTSVSPSSSASLSLSPSASVSPSASRSPSASASLSPSASRSPSASQSRSPSASSSPSASVSPSISPSSSGSPSISASPSTGTWPAIDGFDYFDNSGEIHLVAAAGGAIYRSKDDATTWTACTGANYTSGTTVNMNQNGSNLYCTDGIDNMFYYDGSTTLQTFTVLATPAAASSAKTGLGGTSITYYYKIAAVNTVGFSVASASVSQTVDRTRDAFDTTANFITLTLPAYQASQTRYDIYISTDDLTYNYLDSITSPTLVYRDDGTAIVNQAILAPTGNTTQGPRVEELTNVGSRQYGVRDTDNPYRIWFSSGTPGFTAAFSSAYDGGYLNWQTGGKYRPIKVEDYRDGKGTPLATVFCKSADGLGCVIQMSLDTLTVGNISITVPSAYKLPGSRGTPAPRSVINVLDDYYYYNSQAIYDLGNARNMPVPIISTNELSANIRPSIRQISTSGEQGIVSEYFYARVYISVPIGGSTNNTTIVYDTERRAWLPQAFTLGFTRFLRYVDTGGTPRLLCLKPGDVKLSQISDSIQGDYGQAFNTSLLTGLYPTSKDRFEFQFTEEMEFEFSNPQGSITAELLGTERAKGFKSIKTAPVSISATTINVGWDTFNWDVMNWDDTSVVPTTVSESSVKRYTPVQQELNNVQWHITTDSLDARYVLRTLQTWGTDTQAGHPASWRVRSV